MKEKKNRQKFEHNPPRPSPGFKSQLNPGIFFSGYSIVYAYFLSSLFTCTSTMYMYMLCIYKSCRDHIMRSMCTSVVGVSLSEPHTHQYYEKNCVPIYIYVCTCM